LILPDKADHALRKLPWGQKNLQYYSPLDSNCTCIASYHYNDFHFSELEVLDAEAFLLKHVVLTTGT